MSQFDAHDDKISTFGRISTQHGVQYILWHVWSYFVAIVRSYEYGTLVARQSVRWKSKDSAKKRTPKCSTSLLYKSSLYYSTSLQVEVDSKKSTSLQVESK